MKDVSFPIMLDEDTSYILGLLYGKGRITEEERGKCRFRFEIRYKYPKVEDVDVQSTIVKDFFKLKGVLETELSLRMDIEELPDPKIKFRRPVSITSDPVDRKALLIRRLFDCDALSYHVLYSIPNYLFAHPPNIIRSFLQGIADSTALPPSPEISKGTAAYKATGAGRIQLELEFARWHVAIQVCRMFQELMKAKVYMINWGHPNIRGKDTWKGQNHQLRLYVPEFAKVGFRMSFKRRFFEDMMKKIKPSDFPRQSDYCPRKCNPPDFKPYKCTKHNEGDEDIPQEIRGLHFSTFYQICEGLGCRCRETCRDSEPLETFT